MGRRSSLSPWLVRTLLLALLMLAIFRQFIMGSPVASDDVPVLTSRMMESAGYRVTPQTHAWLGRRVVSTIALQAEHPGCAKGVRVRIFSVDDTIKIDIGPDGVAPSFLFGDWTGSAPPSRPQIIAEMMRIGVGGLFSRRAAKRPTTVLEVYDPSGCLILMPPAWRGLWYG